MNKILIIAPHPDDEVLGCGGTIKKHIKFGDEAYLCLVTKPLVGENDWTAEYVENKDKEIKASNDFMGFKQVFFLDLPALRLDTVPKKDLNDKISNVIEKVKPDVLYAPFFGDINHDHRIVFEACLVASRIRPDVMVNKILAYEISPTTEQGGISGQKSDVFLPNYFEDISDYLDDKLKAMECYKSELKEREHPRSLKGIDVLAKKRGSESGVKAAEAFMLIREIKF
ncbi:MAG: hypothetical protein A2402_03765 [Candidatus Staskawiczbacteria bacterium RIFOXYC1_FULL_37_43]|nr:MAG: hypothetical protein A2813_01505 [Candidatus Staskawiczbacteria bacterium RIFCSPHIGHO2_01_FULL_37_17]OGZ72075.1 MAG: hypothetical protein A2891_01530 [Candidatus Staskawiczbacteria bacterium RIFCSPLOWO2_01_FULL_37_19]OGZ75759.1 MAG: hypothetical protein A2205_02685 [Candidatus Staskawiczbacteria bacterium RIFOXYA1_FULL_37_15]OGZ77190.1 MAG: hypothetical protein A2280_02120 [Candidatus Staskawiczbacteria bacterium RIFOXYA12_FULL_37_10]OGZ80649.1 MAG: hypothetical protein A2353_00365 [Can